MDYTTDYAIPTTTVADEGFFAAILSFFAGFIVFFLIAYIFFAVCMWKIFVKAGKPGWAAIVPFYNIYIMLQIIGKPWWWLIAIFASAIPVVGYFIAIAFGLVVALELGRKFGKDTVFSILALWIFSFIGYPILAFGNAKYDPSAPPVTMFLSGNSNSKTPPAPPADTPPTPQPPEAE